MPPLIETLTPSDIPDNVALAQAVGWQDVESDWRVLHDAALVLGARRERRLVAQGALGVYGKAGTIAKMVVAPECQRGGLGAALLDALLHEASRQSVTIIGLVATPFGQPLYERRKFVTVGEVVVLTGTPARITSDVALTEIGCGPLNDARVAADLNEQWLGCSRAAMLGARFREAAATAMTLSAAGPRGFAMATAQGPLSLVGPIIAETENDARALTRHLFVNLSGGVRVDVPAEQGAFRTWLRGLGLRELGARSEMALGAARLPWQVPQRFALAAQAWG